MGYTLELANLACERDERLLFSGLSHQFRSGQIVQIEGPNGSGKTTLLRILTTLSEDYSGKLLWQGEPVQQLRFEYLRHLLYLGHLPGIKKSLTPVENLRWYTRAAGITEPGAIAAALETVGLYGFEEVPSFQLSAGQQRRVALARLYLPSTARIWILDEPFTAIDKYGVGQLEQALTKHAENGGLVILTTHQEINSPNLIKVNLLDYQGEEQ